MPASKSITADIAVTYPNPVGSGWETLALTRKQAEYLYRALAFALGLGNGHMDNPKAYAE